MGQVFISFRIMFVFTCLLACDVSRIKKKDPNSNPNPLPENNIWSLFFVAMDPLASNRTSTLYRILKQDDSSFEVELISAGEGSDSWLKFSNGNYFLINRSQGQQCIRNLQSQEESFSLANLSTVGDPFDLISLGDGNFLFSNYTEGSISLLDSKSKVIKEKISCSEISCNLLSINKFHPTRLHPIKSASSQEAESNFWLVYHDSLDFKDGKMISNQSQQIFLLSRSNQSPLSWIDLNKSLPGVQGIKLKASFPVFLGEMEWKGKKALVSLGLCSRLLNQESPCKSSIEILDEEFNIEEVFDLNAQSIKMNGASVLDARNSKIYSSVDIGTSDGEKGLFKPVLIEIDLKSRTLSTIYEYHPKYGGYGMLVWDSLHELLWIGDANEKTKTALRAFDPVKKKIIFETHLPELPIVGDSNQEFKNDYTVDFSRFL